jgi:hypothetical protein
MDMKRGLVLGVVALLVQVGALGATRSPVREDITLNKEGIYALASQLDEGDDLGDLEITFDFKTTKPARGALIFRAHEIPMKDGKTEIYGYRVHLDTVTPEAFGGIEETLRRGTLVNPTKDIAKAVKVDDWNHVVIKAQGSLIEVTVNGVTASRIRDEGILFGPKIFVQNFDDEYEGNMEFRQATYTITSGGQCPTESPGHWQDKEWKEIYNGKNTKGWKEWGSESWEVVDGVIEGRRGPKNSEGYLATEKTYTEFRVRGRFKMLGDGNYGLFYHSTITLRPNGYPDISGVQGEVMPGRPAETGRLYETARRGWLMKKDHEDVGSWALREGEWNDIEIRSYGQRITTWVNGIRVIDLVDPTTQVFEGSFALQLHTGEGAGIDWKDIWVKTEGLSAP